MKVIADVIPIVLGLTALFVGVFTPFLALRLGHARTTTAKFVAILAILIFSTLGVGLIVAGVLFIRADLRL